MLSLNFFDLQKGLSLNILDFLGGDIVYVKNNFSHATGSIAGMVSYDAGIQRTTSTDPSGWMM